MSNDQKHAPEVAVLDDYRPHETGWVQCGSCRFGWVGVAPIARDAGGLECPSCGQFEGSFLLLGDEGRGGVTDIIERLYTQPTTVALVREAMEAIDTLRKQQQVDAETYLAIDRRNIELREQVMKDRHLLHKAQQWIHSELCGSMQHAAICDELREALA
jgi:hypothetical protein